eukprot:GHVS01097610.1.p1 GENE.GHVS01097610.1~~GHVS01097610.1.p1  ORF type:complete len:455 (+),score=47.73 GHVS01097610.1:81-1445(+)
MGECFVEEWRDVLGSIGMTSEALRGLQQELVRREEKGQDKPGDDVDEYSLFLLEQSLLLSAVAMEAPVRCGSVGTYDSVGYLERVKVFTDELYAVCWDRLHSGQWLSVSEVWRKLFAVACLLSSALLGCCCLNVRISSNCASDNTTREFYLEKAIFVADMGLILGGNETPVSPCLHSLIHHLLSHYPATSVIPADLPLRLCTQQPLIEDTPPIRHPIYEQGELSLESFICDYFAKNKPVVIRGYASNWSACNNWSDFSYFRKVMGRRTVPIEIGSSYTDQSWTQRLMTVNKFLTVYVDNPNPPDVAYLAQHPLFEQIPDLHRDILTPDFALCGTEGTLIRMMWLGPRHTVSPLHTDPYHNLFVQLAGRKYVRLYHQDQSERLYAFKEGLLTNTSSVQSDITMAGNELEDRFPLFRDAVYQEVVLQPGDALFIPPKVWHFVKALDPSASVSYWFD